MWQLLKSEFRYSAWRSMALLWILPGFYLYSRWSGSQSWYAVPSILTVAVAVQIIIERKIERKDRQHVSLPLSLAAIATVRLSLVLLPAFVLFSLYLLSRLLIAGSLPPWEQGGLDLLMFFGLTVLGFSVYFLQRDVFTTFFKRKKGKDVDIIILLAILLCLILGFPLTIAIIYKERIVSAENIIILLFILGLSLLYPTIISFKQRKSFLE